MGKMKGLYGLKILIGKSNRQDWKGILIPPCGD